MFSQSSILDVSQGSEYVSETNFLSFQLLLYSVISAQKVMRIQIASLIQAKYQSKHAPTVMTFVQYLLIMLNQISQ